MINLDFQLYPWVEENARFFDPIHHKHVKDIARGDMIYRSLDASDTTFFIVSKGTTLVYKSEVTCPSLWAQEKHQTLDRMTISGWISHEGIMSDEKELRLSIASDFDEETFLLGYLKAKKAPEDIAIILDIMEL